MTRLLALFVIVPLIGCSTTAPVVAKFPPAPPELMKKCEELKQVEAGKNNITDLLKTVVHNYQLYYACSIKVEGWQEWHGEQKKIFESVK